MGGRSPSSVLPHADAADRRLLAYALATGAAAVPAADGAIVYTAVNQTVSWSATGNSAEFDVDRAGLNDLRVGWSGDGTTIYARGLDTLSIANVGGDWMNPSSSFYEASNFAAGSPISFGTPTAGAKDMRLASYSSATPFGWSSGTWSSGGTGYLGFQFTPASSGGMASMGWIHVTVPTAAGPGAAFTVHGYAYETVGQQTINAGAVPAPGALLTLALGAVGIRGRRARAA
jgi:hypothetical protein